MKSASFWESLRHAVRGIGHSFRAERNLRLHAAAALLAAAAGWRCALTPQEWCLLLLAMAAVFVAELLNTAVEHAVDLFSPSYSEAAKRAKDAAAGAVLLAALFAAAVGCLLFGSRLFT